MELSSLLSTLVELGFTDLEAQTYVTLVRSGPNTAYGVGRLIGKATANVYKAADALESRGALLSTPGETRVLHAVLPEEFLAQHARRQTESIGRASDAFRRLKSMPLRSGLFQLESIDAVLERARRMLASANEVAVVDCFPTGISRLRPDIEAASDRGVRIYVQAYAPLDLRCTSFIEVPRATAVLEHWKSEQVNLVTDGRDVLLALCTLNLTRVIDAFWSNSAYLACMQLGGLLREHSFHRIRALLDAGDATAENLRQVFDESPLFYQHAVPGQIDLAARIESAEGLK